MLIDEKPPQGHIYPQITQAPNTSADFLSIFRGGHTIDDNLGAANPTESLADIYLTTQARTLFKAFLDWQFCYVAQSPRRGRASRRTTADRTPYVGVVIVKDEKIL